MEKYTSLRPSSVAHCHFQKKTVVAHSAFDLLSPQFSRDENLYSRVRSHGNACYAGYSILGYSAAADIVQIKIPFYNGCLENSDLRPEKPRPSGCLENSDPKNSDPLGVSKTQTI